MKTSALLLLPMVLVFPAFGQVLSTPGGVVSDNGTTDYVLVNGNTKLVNPNGRTLLLERNGGDSWLTFHDPDNHWYSMGLDHSNAGAFTINSGGSLGAPVQFVMTSSGNIGIGIASPLTKFDLNGNFQIYPSGNARTNAALKLRIVPGVSSSIIEANSDYVWADHDVIINGANSGSGNTNQLVVHRTGNVGIGVLTPVNLLDVNGVGRFRRSGSATSGLTIGGDALSLFGWGTHNPYIEWKNSDNTRQGYFGWNTDRLSLVMENGYNFTVENGNVGIGTTSPNERLTVNGTIYGKEVKVDLSVPGPDYVFEEEHNLPPLEEIEHYVNRHKHLPEVPSAKELEANGIELGEMNMLLLKKVEELTLYLIDLKKENNELRNDLNSKIAALESLMSRLDK